MGEKNKPDEQGIKETLQSMDKTLKRIEEVLEMMRISQQTESSEEFYKKHGINYSVG